MESSCVRTYFLNKGAYLFEFDITNAHLIERCAHGHKTIEILPYITAQKVQEIKWKIIIKALNLSQIGGISDQGTIK